MHWQQIRLIYQNQWLIIEALSATTANNTQRYIEQLAVIEL